MAVSVARGRGARGRGGGGGSGGGGGGVAPPLFFRSSPPLAPLCHRRLLPLSSPSVAPHTPPSLSTASPPHKCASRSSASSLHCGKRRPPSQRRPVVTRMVASVPRWLPPPATAVAAAVDPPVGAAGAPRGDHLPLLGPRQSAGRRGACWRPLPTSGRVHP